MIGAIKQIDVNTRFQNLVLELYETYASRLLSYTRKHYHLGEDEAINLVYKTIYRMADVYDRYSFENEQKRRAFVFKTYLNYLRNHYRDNKSFESRNYKVELAEYRSSNEDTEPPVNPRVALLQSLLDKMEDWERILLLMRGQDIPYSEISKFVQKPEKQLKVYYGRLKKKLLEEMNRQLNALNRER
jgi:RNA polymerase sigma factor (sigma-70 family)